MRREANDRLAEACSAAPKRLAAFAALPTPDPKAAADELERVVTKLRLQGRDDPRPHPRRVPRRQRVLADLRARRRRSTCRSTSTPPSRTRRSIEAYYKDYEKEFPMFSPAAWGFASRPRPRAMRLVLSGVFDKYPNLKIILGHMGENCPSRVAHRPHDRSRGGKPDSFRDVFCDRFWITTSGFFSTPLCCAPCR